MANKRAILSSKINLDTSIYGGYIEIIDHELTGIFVDNAMDLILKNVPTQSEEANKKALITAQNTCFSLGLTTVDIAGLTKSSVELIDKLHSSEELKIKTYIMLTDNEENFNHYVHNMNGPLKTKKMNVRSFKFFADGSLGSRGACLINPYLDNQRTHGQLLQNIETFKTKLNTLKLYVGFKLVLMQLVILQTES